MIKPILVAAAVGALSAMVTLTTQAHADNQPHGSDSSGGAGVTVTQGVAPTKITVPVPTVKAKPWHGGKWKVGPGGW